MKPKTSRNPHRRREDSRGSALLLVLLFSLVVTAMLTSLIVQSETDHRISANERDANRALFAARAGLAYAYNEFSNNNLTAAPVGTQFIDTNFNFFSSALTGNDLEGAAFEGLFVRLDPTGSLTPQGASALYSITAVGSMNQARRTSEMVFQVIPESFKYGFVAFGRTEIHNHGDLAPSPNRRVDTTIFSNERIDFAGNITVGGSIVSGDSITFGTNNTIEGSAYGHSITMSASTTIEGDAGTISHVERITNGGTHDLVDSRGNHYLVDQNPTGGPSGGGTIQGANHGAHTVSNGEVFRDSLFRRGGSLLANVNVNVTVKLDVPEIDWEPLKATAIASKDYTTPALNPARPTDGTLFDTEAALMDWLEDQDGTTTVTTDVGNTYKTLTLGTPTQPIFLYCREAVDLDLIGHLDIGGSPNSHDAANGRLAYDALHLEGGIFTGGHFRFNGPEFLPARYPPDYLQLSINALPYCWPAIVAYNEPATAAPWVASDTPDILDTSPGMDFFLNISSQNSEGHDKEGKVYINGLTFSQGESHMHRSRADEEITFNGAQVGSKIHNCDNFNFTYDRDVGCTNFLIASQGSPQVVSYREIR